MPVIQGTGRASGTPTTFAPQLAPLERAFDQRLKRTEVFLESEKGKKGEEHDFHEYTIKPDAPSASFGALLARKPGLQKLLELNKDAILDPSKPKPGQVTMAVAWEGWGHFSVADNIRKEEISLVIAKTGDASTPRIKLPLQNGKTVELPAGYQIVYAGREGDHPRMFEDGGGSQYMQMFDVVGAPGQKLQLAYLRCDPDANGKLHPSHSGWPDARLGGGEAAWPSELVGYFPGGRNEIVTVKAGADPLVIRTPD